MQPVQVTTNSPHGGIIAIITITIAVGTGAPGGTAAVTTAIAVIGNSLMRLG